MKIKGNYLWMNFLCRFWYLLHIDLILRKLCGNNEFENLGKPSVFSEISHFFLLKCVIVAKYLNLIKIYLF
jgi:hypothetical protein